MRCHPNPSDHVSIELARETHINFGGQENVDDRFTRGFLAGVLAGIPTFIFNVGSSLLNLTTVLWLDIMAIFLYGREPLTLGEMAFASLTTFGFVGALGAVFAYLLTGLSHENIIFKAWVFSVAVGFSTFAITQLFAVPEMAFVPLQTVALNFAGASVWGLSLGPILNWLTKKVES